MEVVPGKLPEPADVEILSNEDSNRLQLLTIIKLTEDYELECMTYPSTSKETQLSPKAH